MHHQRGNFLVQALLALTLVFAFIPFFARQLSDRNQDSRMFAATNQIEVAQTAARIFLRENMNLISYDTTVVVGDDFADLLEPYGLPLGFVPRTALGQDIAFIIHKTPNNISAYLELTGGDLSELDRGELARRIGFYADVVNEAIHVGIDIQEIYSDIVRRNEPDLNNGAFLTDLDMGGFAFDNAGNVFGVRGEFETAQIGTLSVTGIEKDRKIRNKIENMYAGKTVFQSKSGEAALSLTRGSLVADSVSLKTVSQYGETGNLVTDNLAVYDMSMAAGRTGFTGPSKWDVRGNLVSDHINFSVERLDVSASINATRGQSVYVNTDELEYSSRSGIDVKNLYVSNITLRDQTSKALNEGQSGAVILDVRPAGTSLLPDVLVSDINNDNIVILENPASDDSKTVNSKTVITSLDGKYNKNSLSQHLLCQYLFWHRLEQRINIKECLMSGRGNCE